MARSMSAEEYQELGRNFYRLKQYDKALETLTKGIESCPKPTISLYDYRAATYDKLERFSDAVKDGRSMIRLDKTDVKGYLRTGNVLEKMGKEETARGIYKHGMKNISAKDKNFKILQQLHDKLTRKLSPAASVDPFSVLPKELAEMVLGYLTFRQMVNCMRVSKGWHTYISRLPRLWMHLNLMYGHNPPPRSFVNAAFARSNFRMTSITTVNFEHMDVISNLAKAGKSLVEVDIRTLRTAASASLIDIAKNSPNLKKYYVWEGLTENTVEQILDARPELEEVRFSGIFETNRLMLWPKTLSHLHTLTLGWRGTKAAWKLKLHKLMRLTPSLRSLEICNVNYLSIGDDLLGDPSDLPPLTTLILRGGPLTHFLIPTTLERLLLDTVVGGLLNQFPSNPHNVTSPLPDLTNLSLSGYSVNAEKMEWLLDSYLDDSDTTTKRPVNGKPLQHLSLRCLLDSDATLCHGPNNILCQSRRILTPALETLDLGTMPCTDDDVEQLLTFDTTGLTDIDLSDSRITGASVKMLVDKLPKLRHLKVDNCTRISGRDSIDYAEKKGVRVSYQMKQQKGGKKVRYG